MPQDPRNKPVIPEMQLPWWLKSHAGPLGAAQPAPMPQDNKLSALGFGPEVRDSIVEALQRMVSPQAAAPAESLLFPTQNVQGDPTFMGRHPRVRRGLEAGLFSLAQPMSAANQQDPLGGLRHGLQGLFGYQQALEQQPLLRQGQADERTLTAARALGSLGAQGTDARYKQFLMEKGEDPSVKYIPGLGFYEYGPEGVRNVNPEGFEAPPAGRAGGSDYERFLQRMQQGTPEQQAIAANPERARRAWTQASGLGAALGGAGGRLGTGVAVTRTAQQRLTEFNKDRQTLMEKYTNIDEMKFLLEAAGKGRTSAKELTAFAKEMRRAVNAAGRRWMAAFEKDPNDPRSIEDHLTELLGEVLEDREPSPEDSSRKRDKYLEGGPPTSGVPRNQFLPEVEAQNAGLAPPAALSAHGGPAAPALGPMQGPELPPAPPTFTGSTKRLLGATFDLLGRSIKAPF